MTTLDQLKQQVHNLPPIAYLESTGLELKRSGNAWKGFCPFHDNTDTPAFVVWNEGNYRCYSCGVKGHDIIAYTQQLHNCDFKEALQIITGQVTNHPSIAIRKKQPPKPKTDYFPIAEQWYKDGTEEITHPYPVKKQISTEVLKMAGVRQYQEKLIIPLIASGKVKRWQIIYPDKRKKRTFGEGHAGCITLGQLVNGEVIFIGEGFATIASLYQLTGFTGLSAMNADGIKKIAPLIRKHFPLSPIVLLCDNDQSNTGQLSCGDVVTSIDNCRIIMSDTVDEDFNDIYRRDKAEAKRLVDEVLAKIKSNPVALSPCGGCEPDGLSKVLDNMKLECLNCGECYETLPAGMNAGQTKYEKRTYSKELEKAALVPLFGKGE